MCNISGSRTKNLAPQAIPIFSPDVEKMEIQDASKMGIDVDEEKEKKPALEITCEMTDSGKNIKKLLESVVKTPLKYVRYHYSIIGCTPYLNIYVF